MSCSFYELCLGDVSTFVVSDGFSTTLTGFCSLCLNVGLECTPVGDQASEAYNTDLYHQVADVAILEQLQNPKIVPLEFKDDVILFTNGRKSKPYWRSG